MSTKSLTKAQLVELFGESAKQIQRYVAEGIPNEGTGRKLRFPWPEVRNWRDERVRRLERERVQRDRPADVEESRRKREELDLKMTERDYDISMNALVPIEVVDETIGVLCDRMLPILQNVPANYGLRLEELGVPADKAEAVLEDIATELTQLLQAAAEHLDETADTIDIDDDDKRDHRAA